MKKIKLLLSLTAALALTSCDGTNLNLFGNKSHNVDGVSQGNGMSEFTQYQNATMGLSFKYPTSWSLLETNSHQVSLNDARINQTLTSNISFSLVSEFNGQHMTSLDDLKAALETQSPNAVWKKAQLLGHEGFWFEEIHDNQRNATYYLLDQNYNVMNISYQGFNSTGGLAVIESIIKYLSVDSEGPVVTSVTFDKSQAYPGETVTLTITAEDELSSINPQSIINNYTSGCINGYDLSALGYKPTKDDWEFLHNRLDCAYPINDIIIVSPTVFQFKFKIPDLAPAGTIQLQTLKVADTNGNASQIFLYKRYTDKFYSCGLNCPKAALAEFEVLSQPNLISDTKEPVIVDMYFDKSKLFANSPIQKLYMKIQDDSSLRLNDKMIVYLSGLDLQQTCYKKSPLKKISADLYVAEYDMTGCFNLGFKLISTNYSDLDFYDAVGNKTQLRDYFPKKYPVFELVN